MKKSLLLLLAACAGLVSLVQAQPAPAAVTAAPPAPAAAPVDASAPIPKTGNARFFELHEKFLARAKAGPIGVLFLGDSITKAGARPRTSGNITTANMMRPISASAATRRST